MSDIGKMYDVCIIGSGAGGAPAAAVLARKGLKIALLERGPHYSDRDLKKDELSVCRMPMFRPDDAKGKREIYYGNTSPLFASHLWTATCVGGGTRVMSGFFFRMKDEDFKPRTRFGAVDNAAHQDWPIELADLQPYYDCVESDIGISGSNFIKNIAPLTAHPVSALIDKACSQLGFHPIPTPRAILSEEWKNRGPCSYSGFCGSYACLTGAKASAHETYIRDALNTGNVTLLPDHYVYFLEAKGNAVRSVHFIGPDNAPGEIRARIFICACSSIETARLLLNSHTMEHPDGLANSSGLVGKNLTFTMPCEVTGFFKKGLFPAPNAAQSPFVQRSIQDLHMLDDDSLSYKRGGTVVFIFPHPNPIQRVMTLSYSGNQRIWGKQLKDRIREYVSYNHLMSDTFIDFLPNPQTFVTISKTTRDYWGIPSAGIHIVPHHENIKAAQIAAKHIASLYEAMGAAGVSYNPAPFTAGELQHGTCRFGNDPKTSVLDPFCRSNDIKNLFVTDASFMPSGLPVPSTFTIMANSLRVAGHIYGKG